jgi:hypothetical protein
VLPFGLETLPPMERRGRAALAICEGESDALAFREAYAGVAGNTWIQRHVVIAVPGASSWRPDWAHHLDGFDVIYVLGDGDRAGRRLDWAVRRDVPHARLVSFRDGDDVRRVLQRDGHRALDPYLARADRDACVDAAFTAARTLDEWERLLRGEEIPDAA